MEEVSEGVERNKMVKRGKGEEEGLETSFEIRFFETIHTVPTFVLH